LFRQPLEPGKQFLSPHGHRHSVARTPSKVSQPFRRALTRLRLVNVA
jgi:hypothetical protein